MRSQKAKKNSLNNDNLRYVESVMVNERKELIEKLTKVQGLDINAKQISKENF